MKTQRTGRNMKRVSMTLMVLAGLLQVTDVAHAKKDRPGDSGVESELKFKAGDENGNEIKALKTELLVMKSEKRALEQLQKLQKKYAGTRMEPEILFRLAELYMRRARTERFFEVHRNSEQVATFVPQLVKDASEAAEIRKAIGIYGSMQQKFPNFRSMDIVIFNNAFAHQQLGEDKEAEQLYFKIIKQHGDSPLVPDSYLAVGEINFNRRNFTFALENFRAIRKFPRARVYPYGLYKAAWSYYNLQDAGSGMKQLEEVVKYGRDMAKSQQDARLDLRKEALGDLALFFGDVQPSSNAVDYFRTQAAELDAAPYIMRLVELYKRHSRLNDVEVVLRDFIAKMPKSEMIASAHEELVWNYERTKQRPEAIAQLTALDSLCENSTPKEVKKLKKGELPPKNECAAKITDASKKLATKWHALWKKQGGDDALAASSEKSYRLYLKNADMRDAELPSVRYSFAELQFARGQYREASEHYAAVEGYQATAKIDPKVAHDAAYAAVVSLEKAVGTGKWNDDDEKRFQVLGDSYVKRFPTGQYVLDIKFKRAFIAYEKERYDDAGAQFKKIGWNDAPMSGPTPEKVLKAQDLYLDILNIKKDYTALKEAAQSLLKRGVEGARTTQIEKIYREAYFSEIQALEEKGDLNGAVEAYKKFALENTGSDLAPKAWWNASQIQFRMGDAEGGANTCYQMHKLFPSSSNGRDCLTRAAQTFEAMARLDLAARVLLNLALVEADKQDKWRETAADFFALSGSKPRAITMYVKLAEGKKKVDDQVALYEKAAVLAADTGDMKTLQSIESKYTQMNIEPQASRLVVEQAEEAFTKGDLTKAFNLSKRVIAKESLPKDILARARIVQAQVLEDEYRKQSVKARVERIGTVLAIKTEKLEKAQKAYQSAIRYGDPEQSVRALRKLAGCYLDYASTVRGMSLPGDVPAADQQVFKQEIEQLTIPMEEKGIEAMSQALDASKKAQLRDGQIAEIQVEVNKLNMKATTQPPVVVVNPSIYVPSFNRAPAGKEVGL